MTEFISWASLGTYGGALVMVGVLTQFTKNIPWFKQIPTQLWSYILAFIVLLCAHAFTRDLTIDIFFQSIFNAGIVSIASNGGYSVIEKIAGKSDNAW